MERPGMHLFVKSGRLLLIFAIAASAFTCTYHPDTEYVSPIRPLDPSWLVIDLDVSNQQDTIRMFGPAFFSYVLKGIDPEAATEATVYLGSQQIFTRYGTRGSFYVSGTLLKTGVHELRIETVSQSGTGSLADKAGEELVETSKKWIISMYVDRPPSPGLTRTETNGYTKVSWQPYPGKYFKEYNLKVEYDGQPGPEMTFTDKSKTSWTDSLSTCNGGSTYTLTVTNIVGATVTTSSGGADALNPKVTYNKSDSTVTMEWEKPKLYANFGHYVIFENQVERMTITDIEQTKATFESNRVGYGYNAELSIERFSKLPDRNTSRSYSRINPDIVTKKLFKPVDKFYFNADLNSIFGYRDAVSPQSSQLVRFNMDLVPVDSMIIFDGPSFDIPYRGPYAYISRDEQIVQLNLDTKAEVTYSPFTLGSGPSGFTAGSNQSISYVWFEPGAAPNTLKFHYEIYNMATATMVMKQDVTTASLTSLPGPAYLSDDGKYFRDYQKRYFDVSPAFPDLLGTVPSVQNSWVDFRNDKSEEFLARVGGIIRVYNVNTLVPRETFESAKGSFVYYDAAARKLVYNDMSGSPGTLWVTDIDTGEVKSHRVNIQHFNFVVVNGRVVLPTGEYFKIY